MEYYLVITEGERSGPYSLDQVRALWNSNQITVNTLAWTEGMEGWKPLGSIESFMRPTPPELSTSPKVPNPPLSPDSAPIDLGEDNKMVLSEPESDEIFYTSIANPSFIPGASPSSKSKIMMGIEGLRNEDYEKALELFHSALEETYAVASGWLGIAWSEAYMASVDRNTIENIRNAANKARQYCPAKRDTISNHHAIVLIVALGQVTMLAGIAYQKYLESILSVQQNVAMEQRAVDQRTGAIIVGTVAAVLGGRSVGVLGKMLGFGIAAQQTFKGAEAHGLIQQSQTEVTDNLQQSGNIYQVALAFVSLASDIITEIKKVYIDCGANVQRMADEQIKEKTELLIAFEKNVTDAIAVPLKPARKPISILRICLRVIIFGCLALFLFVLLIIVLAAIAGSSGQ